MIRQPGAMKALSWMRGLLPWMSMIVMSDRAVVMVFPKKLRQVT
jgi:hypothetical protein